MLFSFSFKFIRPFHFSDWKSFGWGHWGLYMQSNPLRIYRETAGKVCRCRWLKCSHPREQSSHRKQQQLITRQTVWMLLSQILRDFQIKKEKGISLHRAGATAAEVYRRSLDSLLRPLNTQWIVKANDLVDCTCVQSAKQLTYGRWRRWKNSTQRSLYREIEKKERANANISGFPSTKAIDMYEKKRTKKKEPT